MLLRPKPSDCCVFCSYSTMPCPPIKGHHGCREAKPNRT
ncbi:GDCCVxC domain-containing (seleno)protein [Guyparkeria halophila]